MNYLKNYVENVFLKKLLTNMRSMETFVSFKISQFPTSSASCSCRFSDVQLSVSFVNEYHADVC